MSSPAPADRPLGSSDERAAIRVFLVDDHELARIGVRAIVEGVPDFVVVGEAGTVSEAIENIPAAAPDVAIIDLRIGEGNGVDVCRHVRREHPYVQCLVLSAFRHQQAVAAAVEAGASGYLLKQRTQKELVEAVRAVAAGGTFFDPELSMRGGTPAPDRAGEPGGLLDRLSRQERQILVLVAEGRTNRQIAAELFLAESTVKNYVSRLLGKLGMVRRSEAAGFAARLLEAGQFHLEK